MNEKTCCVVFEGKECPFHCKNHWLSQIFTERQRQSLPKVNLTVEQAIQLLAEVHKNDNAASINEQISQAKKALSDRIVNDCQHVIRRSAA